MKNVTITVAGNSIKIISSEEVINIVIERMSKFVSDDEARYSLTIHEEPQERKQAMVTKNGARIEFKEPERLETKGRDTIEITDHSEGVISDKEASYKIKTSDKESKYVAIRNAIRSCYLLWFKDLMALHASGVYYKDRGYIFAGDPGQGKTTIAKLSDGIILNDEFVLLKKENDEVYMYGTPFGGEIKPNNKKVKVDKVFFINKSEETKTQMLPKSETFELLIQNNFLFMKIVAKEEKDLTKEVFLKTKELAGSLDGFKLKFEKNKKVWRHIDEL